MKFIKTKLGLLVMALAFVLVGALGLSPATAVKADGVDTTSGFTMADGAAIRLKPDYNGISWVTTVTQDFYTTNGLTTAAEFGVVVAPTGSYTGELTAESVLSSGSVLIIPAQTIDASAGDVQYRAVVNYANLAVANQTAAFKLELTARAYVKVGDSYYYAPMSDSSRSARQVAVAAELAGEIDEKFRESSIPEVQALASHAEAYYGGTLTKLGEANGSVGTPYINKENPTAAVNLAVELDGEFDEAIIGTKKVAASYDAGALAIADATGVTVSGETYVTVFTSTGAYIAPIIVADKIFDEITDFEIFKQIRLNYTTAKISSNQVVDTSVVDLEDCKFGGYYILANDIDASSYNPDPFGCQAGWTGTSNYVGSGLGLTGTFNGYGHVISGYTVKDITSGIFELINGGTVKNFAMTGLKNVDGSYTASLAYYAINPKIENVYIQATRDGWYMQRGAGLFYYLYQVASGDASIKNTYINLDTAPRAATAAVNTGSIFVAYAGKSVGNLGISNTYVVSNAPLAFSGNKSNLISTYCYAANERDDYLADPKVFHLPEGRAETAPTTNSSTTVYFGKDAWRYESVADMTAARGEAITDKFTPALTGGCFTAVDNVPTWVSLAA